MTRPAVTRLRARKGPVVAALAVVLVLISPLLGRADVWGQYRPVLPPAGLTTGCYPLPGGVVPDFDHVLRLDSDVLGSGGLRRRTVLHLDRTSAAEAVEVLRAQLAVAGVADRVDVRARDFDEAEGLVRGEMVIDSPVIARQSDDPVCRDPNSTKRFTPDLPDRS